MMKTLQMFAAAVALPLVFAQGCGDDGNQTTDDADTGDTANSGEEECDSEISGTIEADTTWTCGHTLKNIVTVKNGAKLTIEPGVTIKGSTGSALVVAKGSQLIAEGTKEEPIVFTSALSEGNRGRGDWGGIVLLGDAKNNLQTGAGVAEGLDAGNPDYQYGGTDGASSCGSLKWLRVEFAGFELTKDNELNGITFYSCGSGTQVDYVQAHMGKDDGIEMFGGTWSGKHIVITGAQDDSIDVDQGFIGGLQHVFIQQDPAFGNYAFELSNQKDNLDAEPRSKPTFVNVTAIGTAVTQEIETQSAGVRLRRAPPPSSTTRSSPTSTTPGSSSPRRRPRSSPPPARPRSSTACSSTTRSSTTAPPRTWSARCRPSTSRASWRTPPTTTTSTSIRPSPPSTSAPPTSLRATPRPCAAPARPRPASTPPTTSARSRTPPATGPSAGPPGPSSEPETGRAPRRRRARGQPVLRGM
ncbi:hypothetical protein [Nannocystis pusilla]|uniref:hypothetical protein n=1 Tax=Nannocystis pusilla TaxID=889268 RepID=UPI003B7892E8